VLYRLHSRVSEHLLHVCDKQMAQICYLLAMSRAATHYAACQIALQHVVTMATCLAKWRLCAMASACCLLLHQMLAVVLGRTHPKLWTTPITRALISRHPRQATNVVAMRAASGMAPHVQVNQLDSRFYWLHSCVSRQLPCVRDKQFICRKQSETCVPCCMLPHHAATQ
jgi:hypothetical protein